MSHINIHDNNRYLSYLSWHTSIALLLSYLFYCNIMNFISVKMSLEFSRVLTSTDSVRYQTSLILKRRARRPWSVKAMRERSLVEIHCFETLESLLVYCIKIHANIICFFIELKTDVGVAPGDGGEKKLLHKQPMETRGAPLPARTVPGWATTQLPCGSCDGLATTQTTEYNILTRIVCKRGSFIVTLLKSSLTSRL